VHVEYDRSNEPADRQLNPDGQMTTADVQRNWRVVHGAREARWRSTELVEFGPIGATNRAGTRTRVLDSRGFRSLKYVVEVGSNR
jgi:hypothetical protein